MKIISFQTIFWSILKVFDITKDLSRKIALWADEFSTDAFGEMLAIICVSVDRQKKLKYSD